MEKGDMNYTKTLLGLTKKIIKIKNGNSFKKV